MNDIEKRMFISILRMPKIKIHYRQKQVAQLHYGTQKTSALNVYKNFLKCLQANMGNLVTILTHLKVIIPLGMSELILNILYLAELF